VGAHFLVIDRPRHGSRVLAGVPSRADAEAALAKLREARPDWSDLLAIRAGRVAEGDDNGGDEVA
jgi:hypothetical protein